MRKLFIILSSLLLSCLGTQVLAIPMQYQGTQEVNSKAGKMVSKVYFDNGKMRIDADIGGMKTTTIMRPDLGKVIQLMPGNIYMEIPMDGMQKVMTNFQDEAAFKRDKLGEETVSGKICEKFQLHAAGAITLLWLEKGSGLPVKLESADKTTSVEWKDVIAGAQDSKLFEIPAGAQKIELGGLMEGLSDLGKNLGQGLEQMPNKAQKAAEGLKYLESKLPEVNKALEELNKANAPATSPQSPPANP